MTFWELVDKKLTVFVFLALVGCAAFLYGAFTGNENAVSAGLVFVVIVGFGRAIKWIADIN